jgi:hypothetical protein
LRNSGNSRRFEKAFLKHGFLQLASVVSFFAILSSAAAFYSFERGYTLYDGDAEAHVNIARRILDSRTPGPEQIGTVWLPLPHVLMIPFAMRDDWWQSGAAGAFVSPVSFVFAGTFLFAAARRVYASAAAAFASALIFALNPNLLYLQSTAMTELIFAASIAALLWSTIWFRDSQSIFAILATGVASNAASLTRYEGWFLIPFVAVYLLIVAKRKWLAVLFGAIAALAPVAWLAHNFYYYGNALEFYNGPWSAMAIYHRDLARGISPYPGDHDWRKAAQYYLAAARWVASPIAIAIGIAGALVALWRRARWAAWPLFFLSLVPLFYIWSMHSSGTPVFVPNLWPNTYYNTRYAMASVLLAAFAGGAIVTILPARMNFAAAVVCGLAPLAFWIGQAPVCWKEAEVNSAARREWTRQTAEFLAAHYQHGSGILFSFGDLTGALREAGIPLREGLHSGNGAEWNVAMARPDLFLHEDWALGFAGDEVTTVAQRRGSRYQLRKQIIVRGAPVVEIYQRQ